MNGKVKPGVLTSENFQVLLIQGITALLLYLVKNADAHSMEDGVRNVVIAAGAFGVQAVALYSYIKSRTEIKKAALANGNADKQGLPPLGGNK